MRQPLRNMRGLLWSGAVGAALVLSGCGSSSSSNNTSGGDTGGTLIGAEQATALVGTLECLLGATGDLLNLDAAQLNVLAGTPLDLGTLLSVSASSTGTSTEASVSTLLDVTVTLQEALNILSTALAGVPDALAILDSVKADLMAAGGGILGQSLKLGDLLSVPADLLDQTVAQVLTSGSDVVGATKDTLTLLDDTVLGIAGGTVGACIPQTQVVLDTLDCVTSSVEGGLGLVQSDLQALSATQLPVGTLVTALADAVGGVVTLDDLLGAELPLGDVLGILQGNLPSGAALDTVNTLLGSLTSGQLTQLVSVGSLLSLPNLAGTLPIADVVTAVSGTATGVLGMVEGLVGALAGGVTECVDPNILIASLGSMLGVVDGTLPLSLSDLMALVSTETSLNDILQAVQSIAGGAGLPIATLMNTPITLSALAANLPVPLPDAVATILETIDNSLPLTNRAFTLNDIMSLPPEILPLGLDPANMSLNDALSTTVNMLSLLEGMAHNLNAESTSYLLNGGVILPLVSTVEALGGYDFIGGLMTLVPTTGSILPLISGLTSESLSPTELLNLQNLLNTILGSGDPTGTISAILGTITGADGNLLTSLLNGLLGGSALGDLLDIGGLLSTLTSLLGAGSANAITDLLGTLTTDPTALLQTLLGLLNSGSL